MIQLHIGQNYQSLTEVLLLRGGPLLVAVIALGALVFNIWSNSRKNRYDRSEFSLKSSLDSYAKAYEYISDGNNDRVQWIAAARAIERGNQMASEITQDVHRRVLEVEQDRHRLRFLSLLGIDDPKKNANFFYGITDNAMSIDDAARKSTRRRGHRSSISSLSESSLYAVYRFAKFPDDYEDPLNAAEKFPDDFVERDINSIIFPGLHAYLRHIRKYHSTRGTLRERGESQVVEE